MKLLFIAFMFLANTAIGQSDSSLNRTDDLPERWKDYAGLTVSDHIYRAGKLRSLAFWEAAGGSCLIGLGGYLYSWEDKTGLGIGCMIGGGVLAITSIVHKQFAFAHLQIAAIKISRKQGISFRISPTPTGISLRASLTKNIRN